RAGRAVKPIRLTIVETHPIQYNAPLFRYLARQCPELDVTVIYASRPTPAQQAVGYTGAFEWDSDLLDGYRSRVVRDSRPGESFDSEAFGGVDVEEIGDAILETKPDVAMVAGWHSRSQVRAIAACNAHGVPLIYRGDTHLAMRPSGVPSFAWRLKTRARARKYSAYLAVGSRARDYLQANGAPPTSIFASPHSVDNAFFASTAEPHLDARSREAARRAFGCSPDEFLVLYVGRINGRKRLDDAIEAVARLGPSAVLLVAGCGDRMPEMQAWAIGRGARVVWSGFLNQRELGRAYAAADCLVLPSVRESWGLVVNEALATGLPAVVSEAVGCAPDL